MTSRWGWLGLCAVLSVAGCADVSPGRGGEAAPAAPVNLSGYPSEYRQGHADGCGSARGAMRRDQRRYASDANYRLGWNL